MTFPFFKSEMHKYTNMQIHKYKVLREAVIREKKDFL